MQVAVPEVDSLGPEIGIDEADLDLVDERMPAAVLDLDLSLHRFVRSDVVLRQGVVDDLEAHLDRHLVRRRRVLAEQVLEDEDGDVRAHLHLADKILPDDLAREQAVGLVVKGVPTGNGADAHGQATPRLTGMSCGER